MNKQQLAEIKADMRCCICGKKSDIVCGECQANQQLACFCERHQQAHRTERTHQALWELSVQ